MLLLFPPPPPSSSSSIDEGIVVWLAYMYTGNVKYIIKHDKLDTSVYIIYLCTVYHWHSSNSFNIAYYRSGGASWCSYR